LDRITHQGLENSNLIAMTEAALVHLDAVDSSKAPAITAAHLLKTMALAGFRPSLGTCVCCGNAVDVTQSETVFFSYPEGGVVCSTCITGVETMRINANVCAWAEVLLTATFDGIAAFEIDASTAFSVLQFCQSLIREHVGTNLKSLQFMFTCGLY
ncbi:MAG: DNA repair protein RecO, partial [Raoultibacter sp.]